MCSMWGLKTQNDVEDGNSTGEGYTLDSLPCILSPGLWEALRLEEMLEKGVKRKQTAETDKFDNKGERVQEGLQVQHIWLRTCDTSTRCFCLVGKHAPRQ